MRLSGAQIVWECLLREGVDVVFGYPGGAILPTYDAIVNYPIHHVLARHEQGAAHAADGYARASGKVGVAMATSGPGATNLVTGIATAMMDSSPIVCITGQVPTAAIGGDAFQETDVTGVTLPITKHNYLVGTVEELAWTFKEAFHVARTGRPGPVLIDIPKDVQIAETDFKYPEEEVVLPGYRPPQKAMGEAVRAAADLINSAERPLILAGHGIMMSGAMSELRAFVDRANVPVAMTLLGLGGLPASHPLNLGMMGMHGEAYVNQAIQEADLLLALGMRFDDRVTGNLKTYAPHSKKVHIDIDASELNKNVTVDIGIVGDLKTVLQQLLPLVEERQHPSWNKQIEEWKKDTWLRDIIRQEAPGKLLTAHVIRDIWEATSGNAIIVTDVGQHQMWEAQYYPHEKPHTLITSGGLGTMGFGLPAGIGAKIACPDNEVWVICGDGGFQMTIQELGTLAQEGIGLKVAIINNGYLGMVRQWQEFFYEKRYAETPLLNPDFCKVSEAYGIPAFCVREREAVIPTVQQARQMEGPALIEFRVEKEDIVYPMVPAGANLDDMIRRPLPERVVDIGEEL